MKIFTNNLLPLLSLVFSVGFLFTHAQNQNDNSDTTSVSGQVTFSVRTVEATGNYAPKHVLAIWVEDDNGFVKTRLARANNRKQYLYMWRAASDYNVIDAITGATLTSHITHTVSWDCTDLNGEQLPDGDYHFFVEFTDKHAQGPFKMLSFTKGPEPQHIQPFNEQYFKDMDLEWIPDGVGIETKSAKKGLHIYPNPGTDHFTIDNLSGPGKLSVYNSNGQLVYEAAIEDHQTKQLLKLENEATGAYLVEFITPHERLVRNLIKK